MLQTVIVLCLINLAALAAIYLKVRPAMATLDEILADVTEQETVLDSLNTLFAGLQQQIADLKINATDQAKIDAIFAKTQANEVKLAAALTANTPADPE